MERSRRLVRAFALIVFLGLLAVSVRLAWVQLVPGARAARAMEQQSTRAETLPARRGSLSDRHGRLLVSDADTLKLWAVPRNIRSVQGGSAEELEALAAWLAPRVATTPAELVERLVGEAHTALGRTVTDPFVMDELAAAQRTRLRGVDLSWGRRRQAPWSAVAGNLLGYVSHEGSGVAGLEQGLDGLLSGTDGERRRRVDVLGRELYDPDLPARAPRHGRDVQLTLDVHIQGIVEQELLRVLETQEASRAVGVLMDPRSGEVLALASVPRIDLSDRNDRGLEGSVVAAVQEVYPPGSTFKPLMMAVALELGLAHPAEPPIPCLPENGRFGGRRIRDSHPQTHPLNLEEIIVHSSNIGMAQILTRICDEETPRDTAAMRPVWEKLGELGFGRPTGVPLPAEVAGLVTPLNRWTRNYTLASVAFGQEIAVSTLQMAAGASSLADGLYRPPRLILGVADDRGVTREAPEPEPRRVFDAGMASRVRSWMAASVEQGTCPELQLPGIAVAGKTGTADAEREPGSDAEVHSFTALVPAEAPALTMVVMVRDPKHARYASQSAAPTGGRILRRVLPYLGHALMDRND